MEQRFRQKEDRILSTWSIGPAATSTEDIAFRKVLNKRYLEAFLTTQGKYKAHLDIIACGIPIRQIKGVPILLLVDELPEEKDNHSFAGCIANDNSAV